MAKDINASKFYITSVELTNFRLIDNILFKPARLINVFVGKNGTAKSTILGLLAQGFSFNPSVIYGITQREFKVISNKKTTGVELNQNEEETYNNYLSLLTYANKNFESRVNEHFNLSIEDARNSIHANICLHSNVQSEKDICFKIESNDYKDRKNPRLVTRRLNYEPESDKIDKSSSNVEFPLIYLGLGRVLPIVEAVGLTAVDLGLEDSDLNEIYDIYESILLKKYVNRAKGISNKRDKSTIAFMPESRALEMISSGEDNIGQILLALFSFKKLKKKYSNYQGGILLIDEIDATLYPAAQNKLMDIIYSKSREFGIQVFVTTHSLSLIEHTMEYRSMEKYRQNSVEIFSLYNEDSDRLGIENVKSLRELKNEFFASNGDEQESDKINVYFEDHEAQYIFNALVNKREISNLLKFQSGVSMGCTQYKHLHELKIYEFTKGSIVCLDGDEKIGRGFKNFLTLPIIKDMPPERFVFEILNDEKSDYWKQTKNYTHPMFMNNPHYTAIRNIIGGSYGSEEGNLDGPYNTPGGEYYKLKPREVWKMWYKSEINKWKGRNNPVKFWKNTYNGTALEHFYEAFVNCFNYVSIENKLGLMLEVKDNEVVLRKG